ncbi:MAG TPA: PA2779 family protein [Burkholderiales bacterium]|nr:PA2779 family protein [Burkholderiales bacterium]
MRFICRLLVISIVMLPFQTLQAGMIGADQVVAAAGAQAERQAILGLVSRSDIASQLQSLGVDARTASDRVAAMTDEEVRSLAGQLNSLPAGATDGWVWAAVIIIGVLIWYNFYK